jgi:hypothetical protein
MNGNERGMKGVALLAVFGTSMSKGFLDNGVPETVKGRNIQGDTKKRELLKCVVAAMYSWQHCGTGTLSYRQPRHLVIIDQWNGQQRAFAIKMF